MIFLYGVEMALSLPWYQMIGANNPDTVFIQYIQDLDKAGKKLSASTLGQDLCGKKVEEEKPTHNHNHNQRQFPVSPVSPVASVSPENPVHPVAQ